MGDVIARERDYVDPQDFGGTWQDLGEGETVLLLRVEGGPWHAAEGVGLGTNVEKRRRAAHLALAARAAAAKLASTGAPPIHCTRDGAFPALVASCGQLAERFLASSTSAS